jgi:hypothetical protein
MVTKRGRPTREETLAKAREAVRTAERAARRGRSRQEDVGEVPSPLTYTAPRSLERKARRWARKAAVSMPGVVADARLPNGRRIAYIFEDGELRNVGPYRLRNGGKP